ncbi:hypothetical protein [Streptomyces sp. NPDC005930]|uniref:hypothetical protein n=1 Tax=Streptomyces sp. NPDC005930 TaxID=3364736 RepID=UPI0036B3EE50
MVNAMASVNGRTSTGVHMGGVDHVTAAPATATPAAVMLAAVDGDAASVPLMPLSTATDTDEPASLADAEGEAESGRRVAAYAETWGTTGSLELTSASRPSQSTSYGSEDLSLRSHYTGSEPEAFK